MNTEPNWLTLEEIIEIIEKIEIVNNRGFIVPVLDNSSEQLIELYWDIALDIMQEQYIDKDLFVREIKKQKWFQARKLDFVLANMREKYNLIAIALLLLTSELEENVTRGIEIISQYPDEQFLTILLEKLLNSESVNIRLAIADHLLVHFPREFWSNEHKGKLSSAIDTETCGDVLTVLRDIESSI